MNPIVEPYVVIVKAIARTFGMNCEVALFDTEDVDHALVYIENGHITGREIGAPLSDILCYLYRTELFSNSDLITNYRTTTTSGKKIKTTIIFIRDERRIIKGFLCIDYFLEKLLSIAEEIKDFCSREENLMGQKNDYTNGSTFRQTIDETFSRLFQECVKRSNKSIEHMKKADRIELIRYLRKRGVFTLSGSVDEVAKRLGVSRYTIYSYLAEIKREVTMLDNEVQ